MNCVFCLKQSSIVIVVVVGIDELLVYRYYITIVFSWRKKSESLRGGKRQGFDSTNIVFHGFFYYFFFKVKFMIFVCVFAVKARSFFHSSDIVRKISKMSRFIKIKANLKKVGLNSAYNSNSVYVFHFPMGKRI